MVITFDNYKINIYIMSMYFITLLFMIFNFKHDEVLLSLMNKGAEEYGINRSKYVKSLIYIDRGVLPIDFLRKKKK